MARTPAPFRQAHVKSAIKAALAAGLVVSRVEFDSAGKYSIVTSEPAAPPPAPTSDLDAWRAKRNARSA